MKIFYMSKVDNRFVKDKQPNIFIQIFLIVSCKISFFMSIAYFNFKNSFIFTIFLSKSKSCSKTESNFCRSFFIAPSLQSKKLFPLFDLIWDVRPPNKPILTFSPFFYIWGIFSLLLHEKSFRSSFCSTLNTFYS